MIPLCFGHQIAAFAALVCHCFCMHGTVEDLDHPQAVLKRKSRPLTVFLDESLLEALREVAAGHERSMSGELRHLVRRYIDDPEAFSV